MFKSIVFIALFVFVFAECKPSGDIESSDIQHHRIARSPQLVQNGFKLTGQMANEGIQLATKGMETMSQASQQAVSAAANIGAQVAKNVGGMI